MGATVREPFDIVWSIAWKKTHVGTHARGHARPAAPCNYSSTDNLRRRRRHESFRQNPTPNCTPALNLGNKKARHCGEFVSQTVSFHRDDDEPLHLGDSLHLNYILHKSGRSGPNSHAEEIQVQHSVSLYPKYNPQN